jgi:L-ascorbate metabolism protein UlaG (beta-lactamase superfamily)
MQVQFLAHSCFKIKGKNATVVTDPFDPKIGFKLPPLGAEIVTVSHRHYDHNNFSVVRGTSQREKPFVVNGPGEYEIAGVSIFGTASFHDDTQGSLRGKNTIYLINIDNLKLVHLGDLGHKLSDEQFEAVDGADILFIPVGGTYTIDGETAVEVVAQIEPAIVIPMHYRLPELKIKLDPVGDFFKALGEEEIKPVPKLIISREKLPEERKVVVLKPKVV